MDWPDGRTDEEELEARSALPLGIGRLRAKCQNLGWKMQNSKFCLERQNRNSFERCALCKPALSCLSLPELAVDSDGWNNLMELDYQMQFLWKKGVMQCAFTHKLVGNWDIKIWLSSKLLNFQIQELSANDRVDTTGSKLMSWYESTKHTFLKVVKWC